MATASLTSALSITQSANPPRAVFLDYPLGHTAGPPGDPATQLEVARAAVTAIAELTEPGSVRTLPHEWATDWKPEARALNDHRSERYDTPQYQLDADRDAAVAAHGEAVACEVCAPAEVPAT